VAGKTLMEVFTEEREKKATLQVEDLDEVELLGEPCPVCHARRGQWCVSPKGGKVAKLHKERVAQSLEAARNERAAWERDTAAVQPAPVQPAAPAGPKPSMVPGRELVELSLIDDNPYQPRLVYHKKDVDELAESVKAHGLLQVPTARRRGDRVQLAYGHLRTRAFRKLAKDDATKWGSMPLDIRELSDAEMFEFALEENLRRRDVTPIEVAKSLDHFLTTFPGVTEALVAKRLNMTQGNISNMRRVLRLPDQVLEKIENGQINFTMGRELLIFDGLDKAKDLMLEAIRGLESETQRYGHPNTVAGLQKSIDSVARHSLLSVDKSQNEYSWSYRQGPLFDTKAASCFQCSKMLRTHPTKSQVSHWCTDSECWNKHQQDHKDQMAAEARAKMQADVLRKVAEVETKRVDGGDISQEISAAEQPSEGVLEDEEVEVLEEAILEEDEDELTPEEEKAERARAQAGVRDLPAGYPCHGCLNAARCDRSTVIAQDNGTFTCKRRVTKDTAQDLRKRATVELPPELEALAKEKAGTRAEVLDLNELWLNTWHGDLKTGYALLTNALERIDDPDECTERCTAGFHYGFDSRRNDGAVQYICSNPKCFSKKKAAFTRARNAAGQGKKKAELAAVKTAVEQTIVLDRPRMKLIVQAQLRGGHTSHYGDRSPWTWWQAKLGVDGDQHRRQDGEIFAALDKLNNEELAKAIVEFMLWSMLYQGDVERYKVQTTEALNWMGVGVTTAPKKAKAS